MKNLQILVKTENGLMLGPDEDSACASFELISERILNVALCQEMHFSPHLLWSVLCVCIYVNKHVCVCSCMCSFTCTCVSVCGSQKTTVVLSVFEIGSL